MNYSTVITTFNRRHCIARAIDSALEELPEQEVIVIDDASTDETAPYLRNRYADMIASGRLIIFCSPKNVGVTGAKNLGYQLAQGNWVIFLDSDDYYVSRAGKHIQKECHQASGHPILFFRCQTQNGSFVGYHKGQRMLLDLSTYVRFTSFGEALTAVNKNMVGNMPPYPQDLRGYEGLGCARLIQHFGPALLSDVIARVYVTQGEDRLSASKGFLRRMPLLAIGHCRMSSEFGSHLGWRRTLALRSKALIYFVLGKCYGVLSGK